ncbi:hypothetical protein JCM6882_009212 [Rhodosporidiobolus microsporus]
MTLSTAPALDAAVAEATADPYHGLPRLAVLATTSAIPVAYSSFGGFDQLPPTPGDLSAATKLTEDSIYSLWSCTKLVTTIAALQLVERGEVGLEDDASRWLPELKELKLFKSFKENGEAELVPVDTVVTVKQLLTHTAGFVYEYHEPMLQLTKKLGLTLPYASDSRRESVTGMPCFFPPGERWHYGPSNDWLSLLIEKASGLDLDAYFKKYIFEPLDIHDTTYKSTPTRMTMAYEPKSPGGPYTFDAGREFSQQQYFGGSGLYGSAPSYLKILRTLLRGGKTDSGAQLLKPETVDSMFVNYLDRAEQMEDLWAFTKTGNDPWNHKGAVKVPALGYGYGGNLTREGLPSGRGKGALTWSGFANTYWVVDREKDVAFLVWTNIIPHSSPKTFEAWEKVEPLIYQGLAEQRAKITATANTLRKMDMDKIEKQIEQTEERIVEGKVDTVDTKARYLGYLQRIRPVLISSSRYLAYSSDVGESFRPVVAPRAVTAAYGISWLYVGGDVAYEGYKASLKGKEFAPEQLQQVVGLTVAKRAIFQATASMLLPSLTIHSIVKYSALAIKKQGIQNTRVRQWLPSALGLGFIPALPFLFDEPVEHVVDQTFDKIESSLYPDANSPIRKALEATKHHVAAAEGHAEKPVEAGVPEKKV